MKKLLTLLTVLVISISLLACNTTDNSNTPSQNQTTNINAGDKITTNTMEVVINSVTLTYDVLPDDTSGFYTHYAADIGKVYISIDASVTNNAKQNIKCSEIGTAKANYNNGYTYTGFTVVKDSVTGFTYSNITSIDPLETKGIKWLIECPEEVETSNNSLFVIININNKDYKYTIR